MQADLYNGHKMVIVVVYYVPVCNKSAAAATNLQ